MLKFMLYLYFCLKKKKIVCDPTLWITEQFGGWDFLFFRFEIKFLVQHAGRNLQEKMTKNKYLQVVGVLLHSNNNFFYLTLHEYLAYY